MGKKVMFHSFKGGTGKTNLLANLAVTMALKGLKVGVVDLDLKAPGLHSIFNIDGEKRLSTLNEVLVTGQPMGVCLMDLTDHLMIRGGELYFIPASVQIDDILDIFRGGYEVDPLAHGLNEVMGDRDLDIILIDSHPGLDEETLIAMAICDSITVLSRLDRQDYTGTAVTLQVLERLRYDRLRRPISLIVNQVPEGYDLMEIKEEFERTFNKPVIGTFPFYDEVFAAVSSGVFCLKRPSHPFSMRIVEVAESLLEHL
ncbi:MAG: MinD/ParA family protein [Candidatus Bathyarchaeia archaeon]